MREAVETKADSVHKPAVDKQKQVDDDGDSDDDDSKSHYNVYYSRVASAVKVGILSKKITRNHA